MKNVVLAATFGLTCAAPATAQMTQASCAVSWGMLSVPLGLSADLSTPNLDGDRCVVRDLDVRTGRLRLLVDEVRWQLDGLEALLISGTLLDRAEISARGVYVMASTGMTDFDYVLEAQARAAEGISVDLLATHAGGTVTLDHLHVGFSSNNEIDATLRLDNVDPRAPDQAVIRALRLEVLTHGLFESFALMPLANLLLSSDEEAEVQVARLQTQAIAAIDGLPEPMFQSPTRDALVALVLDMPNPAGRVIFDLQAEDGLPLSQFSEDAGLLGRLPVTDPLEALAGAELQIRYIRPGEE